MADMEDVLGVLHQHLESDAFHQKLVEVFTRHGDPKGAEWPTVFSIQRWTQDTFPSIELAPSMERNMSNESIVIDLLNEVNIFWHERADEELELQWRVLRAMRSIREYFEENKTLHPVGSVVYLGDTNISPFVPLGIHEARPYLRSGLIQIYVRTFG